MNFNTTRRGALISLTICALPIGADAKDDDTKSGTPLVIELSKIALPLVRNGVLINYLFGVLQIQVSDAASTFYLRAQHYLLRDAIIRIASRSPVPAGSAPRSFDRVAVTRIVMQAVQAVRPSTRVINVRLEEATFLRG